MKIIGITGGIASGKSLISNKLKEWGYYVIDTDKITHQLLEKEEVIKRIVDTFGEDIYLNNAIDRKKIGAIIFRNKEKQQTLNNIIHPLVIERVNELIKTTNERIVFVDVPLLYESGMDKMMDVVIVVTVSFENQVKRLMMRDKIDEEFALAKIKMQMPLEQKEKLADYVIDNNDNINDTFEKLEYIIRRIENEI